MKGGEHKVKRVVVQKIVLQMEKCTLTSMLLFSLLTTTPTFLLIAYYNSLLNQSLNDAIDTLQAGILTWQGALLATGGAAIEANQVLLGSPGLPFQRQHKDGRCMADPRWVEPVQSASREKKTRQNLMNMQE